MQWVNEKTGDTSFQQMIREAMAEQQKKPACVWSNPEMSGDLFEHRGRNPPPQKNVALQLIQGK